MLLYLVGSVATQFMSLHAQRLGGYRDNQAQAHRYNSSVAAALIKIWCGTNVVSMLLCLVGSVANQLLSIHAQQLGGYKSNQTKERLVERVESACALYSFGDSNAIFI